MKCVAKEGTYGMNVCQDERDDYMECLHHTKLVSGKFIPVYVRILMTAPPCTLMHMQHRRLETIKLQKEKLIKDGKWPPKDS